MEKRIVVWGRCYCGRMDGPVRRLEGHKTIKDGPFCAENTDGIAVRCRPLSEEERARPGVKAWYTRCHYEDLDAGIRDVVRYLHHFGVETIGSCDGHFERSPYLQFYDADARDDAAELLTYLEPVREDDRRPALLLGTVYLLRFPKVFIQALAERKKAIG